MLSRVRPAIAVGILTCLCAGGCPRPEDSLEPNNSPDTATVLAPGVAVEGRVVQDNPDVFAISAVPGRKIIFLFETLGGEDCPDFEAAFTDGTILYADGRRYCSRLLPPSVQAEGAELIVLPGFGYRLTVPAERDGVYYLTIRELGYADNLFTYSWDYRLTADVP